MSEDDIDTGGTEMTTALAEREVTTTPIPELTLRDFCDASAGAEAATGSLAEGSLIPSEQAYVRVEVRPSDSVLGPGQYLDFCAHHYAELEAEFLLKGYRVLDTRERLNVKTGTEVS